MLRKIMIIVRHLTTLFKYTGRIEPGSFSFAEKPDYEYELPYLRHYFMYGTAHNGFGSIGSLTY